MYYRTYVEIKKIHYFDFPNEIHQVDFDMWIKYILSW